MSNFKEKILHAAITPENLGKLLLIAMCGAFSIAVWVTNSYNETANLKQSQRQNTLQISANTGTVASQAIQISQLLVQSQQDKILSEERTVGATADRARIQRTLDLIMEKL